MLPFETLLFIHIPKTAGITFRGIVTKQFNDSELLQLYPECPGYQQELDHLKKINNLRDFKAVMGHFYYGLHKHFSQKSVYVTFIRNPLHQVLSTYNHLINSDLPSHKEIITKADTFEKFISTEWATNIQTLYISGVSQGELIVNPQEILQLAKNHLKQDFLAVGVTDRFNESLFLLKHLLKWRSVFYYSHNLASQRPKRIKLEELSPDIIKTINNNNNLDWDLYKFANQLLDDKLSNIPLINLKLAIFQGQYKLMKKMVKYPYLYNIANLMAKYW